MKRRDLLKLFKKNGWWKLREGGSHTVYTNGKDTEPVPRHNEVNEITAKEIIKRCGLK
ncbi:type II toxin-antitoxin system HicA family toxin [Ruminococcaceae bacterium OttesenSCG-928-A16]|nr:type II toxin-antitoxin system HicA family toxin [Ruminococcaceae bacterium OttesenSCG-928-A16]